MILESTDDQRETKRKLIDQQGFEMSVLINKFLLVM